MYHNPKGNEDGKYIFPCDLALFGMVLRTCYRRKRNNDQKQIQYAHPCQMSACFLYKIFQVKQQFFPCHCVLKVQKYEKYFWEKNKNFYL